MNDAEPNLPPQSTQPPDEWAIVEIFGHRKHAGRITEVERFGAKMLRIDVPQSDQPDADIVSHFYGGSSIFSLVHVDERTARRLNKPFEVYSARLPAPKDGADQECDDDEPF